MQKNIHLSGTSDGLKQALEERLIRAGASIVADPGDSELIVGVNQKDKCDIAIVPQGSESPKTKIVIELEDVIIPGGGESWGNQIMKDWVRQIKEDIEPVIEPVDRFWVNVRDVTDAITCLCMNEKEPNLSGRFRMCGRRAWSSENVIDEIRILWERYNNAINHSHTIESLSEIPSPVRGIYSEKSETPDLGGIHQALIASGSEGWHPIVPMRVSIMEMIALTD
tara:strand:- start:45 stop:716 length:672 start_codon:yes stop_codon:yes gene_type:complete